MSHCEDCGTRLSDGVCPNCQEELFIFDEQNEYLPEQISDEFISLVNEQREQLKKR